MKKNIFRYGTFLVCLLGMLSAFGPFVIQRLYGFSPFVFSLTFGFNALVFGVAAASSILFKTPRQCAHVASIGLLSGSLFTVFRHQKPQLLTQVRREINYLAMGRCELYFEYLLDPWDFAAASLIVSEAGGIIAANDFTNHHTMLQIVSRHINYGIRPLQ